MTIKDIIQILIDLVQASIPIAMMVALLIFFWGVFMAFGTTDDVAKRTESRNMIMWSLIALFVVATLGGIIGVATETFRLDSGGTGYSRR
jgi:hypothetical protein